MMLRHIFTISISIVNAYALTENLEGQNELFASRYFEENENEKLVPACKIKHHTLTL